MAYHGHVSLGEPETVVQIGVHTIDTGSQLHMEFRGVCAGDRDFWRGRTQGNSNR